MITCPIIFYVRILFSLWMYHDSVLKYLLSVCMLLPVLRCNVHAICCILHALN